MDITWVTHYQATTSLARQVTAITHPSHTMLRLTIIMRITYAWSAVLYSWAIYIFASIGVYASVLDWKLSHTYCGVQPATRTIGTSESWRPLVCHYHRSSPRLMVPQAYNFICISKRSDYRTDWILARYQYKLVEPTQSTMGSGDNMLTK